MNAIELRGLTRRFGARTAVDDLSFTVPEGSLIALLGVNGAGKTTTVRMLSGLLRPSGGDALVLGESIVEAPEKARAQLNISPQETAVAPNLSLRENLEFIARLHGAEKATARTRAEDLLERFGMAERAGDKARTLSGGMQRRLSIAMALITEPKILFLDEPTLGLDVLARRELWQAIEGLKGRMTIVLTTHYMEEAEALSDQIAVLQSGHLKALGTAAELMDRTGTEKFEDAFVALAGGEGL